MSEVTCAVGCGRCCDPVTLMFPLTSLTRWAAEAITDFKPDVDVNDEEWARWTKVGWTDEDREYVASQLSPEKDRRNADFAAAHWHELLGPEREANAGSHRISCDAFDPHTRSCTVHETGEQPPVCSDYPRYGLPPGDPGINYGIGMSPACSFNAEVRTMLPIVEVR